MAVEFGPRDQRLQDRGLKEGRDRSLSGRGAVGFRFAEFCPPFGRAIENAGVLGPPGDAARQSPAAMATLNMPRSNVARRENSRRAAAQPTGSQNPYSFTGLSTRIFLRIAASGAHTGS